MGKFAFRSDPDPHLRANFREELKGHEYAAEGMSRDKFHDITNAVDKAQGKYDDLPNASRHGGFERMRQLQYAQARLHRMKMRTKLAPD